jgi:hypothetical protein
MSLVGQVINGQSIATQEAGFVRHDRSDKRRAIGCQLIANSGRRLLSTYKPEIDFALDIFPFFGCAKFEYESFEGFRILRRVFKPGEKIKGLTKITGMM